MKYNSKLETDDRDSKAEDAARQRGRKGKKSSRQNRHHSGNNSKGSDCSPKFSNDAKWYKKLPEISSAITSNANFLWPLGKPYPYNYQYTVNGGDNWDPQPNFELPGVAVVWTAPWFGTSQNQYSALNVAKIRLYTFDRKSNSGATNYDPEDLTIHIAAATSIVAKINEGIKLYGLIPKNSTLNRYLPEYLFNSMGYDFDAFQDKQVWFRSQLNLIIYKMASVNIPAGISYFDREAFIYSGVYSEGETIKDQIYTFAPAAYMQFALDADNAGCLAYVYPQNYKAIYLGAYQAHDADTTNSYWNTIQAMKSSFSTPEIFISELKAMVNAFFELNDFSVMNGDIEKAWGSNLMKFKTVDENYDVPITFDLTVLEQIKNGTIVNVLDTSIKPGSTYKPLVQSANKDLLITNQSFSETRSIGKNVTTSFPSVMLNAGNQAITAHSGQPNEDIQLENTRFTAVFKNVVKTHEEGSSTTSWSFDLEAGSDLILTVSILGYRNGTPVIQRLFRSMVAYGGTINEMNDLFYIAEQHSRFEFLPKVDLIIKPSDVSATTSFTNYQLFNYSNFALFDKEQITEFNQICIESLLYVD